VQTLKGLASRRRDDEEGFTLIELMVVVLIIAILIAIAIPTFLGARQRANDRAAQSSLRNALTAAKTSYTDNSDYSTATAAAAGGLHDIEPSLTYEVPGTSSTGFKDVSVTPDVGTTNAQTWAGAVLSKSGKCFWLKDIASGATAGTYYGSVAGPTCTGTAALAAAAATW
jgi:type IV pilus assembly protein PilA